MDPHSAGGVQNHWFYLLAEGSHPNDPTNGRPNSPTCDGSRIDGIGIQRAGMVFMEMLNRKISLADWFTARRGSLYAAVELFPDDCRVFRTVRAAWDAVDVHRYYTEPDSCP
jgi:Zn-dependent metalloprotease